MRPRVVVAMLHTYICVCVYYDRVDPDSSLHADMQVMKEKEGYDHILFNFTFKVRRGLIHFRICHCCLISSVMSVCPSVSVPRRLLARKRNTIQHLNFDDRLQR